MASNEITLHFVESLTVLHRDMSIPGAKAILIPVRDSDQFNKRIIASGLATKLAENNFHLFAFIGEESELAHDSLDIQLVCDGFEEFVTTWHEHDLEDVAIYLNSSTMFNDISHLFILIDNTQGFGPDQKDMFIKFWAEFSSD